MTEKEPLKEDMRDRVTAEYEAAAKQLQAAKLAALQAANAVTEKWPVPDPYSVGNRAQRRRLASIRRSTRK